MAIKKIDRSQWRAYFDTFSRPIARGKQYEYAEIRVLSPEFGAQPETSWLPLIGIAYDDRADVLEITVEHMDHRIAHPRDIFVDETPDGVLCSLEVVQEDETRAIIELR